MRSVLRYDLRAESEMYVWRDNNDIHGIIDIVGAHLCVRPDNFDIRGIINIVGAHPCVRPDNFDINGRTRGSAPTYVNIF